MSSFLSASNIFLIVTLLDPLLFISTVVLWFRRVRTGPLGITFPMLFPPKWFFMCSGLFLQIALYALTLQNQCLMRWRSFLIGFRSVLVTATGKPFRLNFWFGSRDLVLSDPATCTIASRVNLNSFDTKLADVKLLRNGQNETLLTPWMSITALFHGRSVDDEPSCTVLTLEFSISWATFPWFRQPSSAYHKYFHRQPWHVQVMPSAGGRIVNGTSNYIDAVTPKRLPSA